MCKEPLDPFLSKNWERFDDGMKLFFLISLAGWRYSGYCCPEVVDCEISRFSPLRVKDEGCTEGHPVDFLFVCKLYRGCC